MTARRIAEDIEARIRSGEWPPGFRIPGEVELAAHYGCARGTANKAMAGLAQAGLVERRRKGGSFVARPPIQTAVLEIPDIAAVVAARGQSYRFELLARRRSPAPETGDGFGRDGEWLMLTGRHLAAGRPFAFEYRLISLLAAPDADGADFSAQAPGSWLLAHIPWTQARHRITARHPDSAAAVALEISAGAACLQVERWTWRQAKPVTFVQQLFPGDAYALEAAFTPGV